MDKQIPIAKRRCKAMIDAGIEDPESSDGITFCTGDRHHESQCPYDYCAVVEVPRANAQLKRGERVAFARALDTHGVSRDDIALIMSRHLKTIHRYLER